MEAMTLALLGLLIVISPGADFVLVLKNSLNQGRKAGIVTALGIGAAISVHIAYSVLGISYLISQNVWLFELIRYCGSAYLIYLGVKGFFNASSEDAAPSEFNAELSSKQYFAQGLLCNLLNPKTMLFFLSIFSQVFALDGGSLSNALIYGVYMILMHAVWFCFVATLFTSEFLGALLQKTKKRLNQACGLGLFAFGILLATKP